MYSSKVWVTGVSLGPVIYYIWRFPPGRDILDTGLYILLALPGGLIVTAPCWLLLWAGTSFILKKSAGKSVIVQKSLLAAWAIILTISPFIVLFGNKDPNTGNDTISMWFSYSIPILAAVFYYRLPIVLQPDKDLPAI